jgi:uncharacterized protein YprB with RNaseH-like and TPR domain
MLTSTFCHIPGIGTRIEEKLWEEGIRTWDDCVEIGAGVLGAARARSVEEHLYLSREALDESNVRFFAGSLPAAESWRMFPEFRGRIAYLDIETTGLSFDGIGDGITTIALYDGHRIRHYVQGENLQAFKDDIFEYDLLVTYNGKTFDVPFIENYFMIRLDQAHIDLRYVLASLGLRGGLKGCERQLGLDRGDLDGVDGFFAVLLWNEYRNNGNGRALDTLLAYNIQDTVTLEALLTIAYNMKIEDTPFGASHRIELASRTPESPFAPDLDTIDMLRRRHYGPDVHGSSYPFAF